MELKTMVELRDIAYREAKKNGFFLDDYADECYIAAIHEELSEAFRAWNKGLGWLTTDPKPDGIYFELTDAVIRTLSYCGYKGIELMYYDIDTDRPYVQSDLADVILKSHKTLTDYYEQLQMDTFDDEYYEKLFEKVVSKLMSKFIARIELFIAQSSKYKLVDLIQVKLNYNRTRGKKHGSNEV